jgi:hypothetical protein
MRRAVLLPAVLAVALLAAACSSGPGPLGPSAITGVDCGPASIGQAIIVGFDGLVNGKSQLTVNSVRLTDNHGLAMGVPWLVPLLNGDDNMGMGYPWPPTLKQFPQWRYRRHADGAVVRPGQNPDLVIPVWRTGKKAGQASITVYYTANGNTYTWTGNWQVAIAANCNNVPI